MAALMRVGHPYLWKSCRFSLAGLSNIRPVMTDVQQRPGETFIEKNARLKRPLSPHLGIYKFQITSTLSITHRITGLILSGGLYGLSIGMLALPHSFPYYMDYLHSMSVVSPVIYALKFSLAWMFFYHTANGVRHLAWDLGYGYDMQKLHGSGYAVVGSSLILSALTAAL